MRHLKSYILSNEGGCVGFDAQCLIFMHLINLVESNIITTPLYDESLFPAGQMNNKIYVKALITDIIQETFRHVQEPQFVQFLEGLFDNCKSLQKFADHVRDFLIASKEIAGAEDLRLYTQARETTLNANVLNIRGLGGKDPLATVVQDPLRVSEVATGTEDMAS